VRTDVEICLLHHTLILYIQGSECLQIQSHQFNSTVKPVAVVSDAVTVTVASKFVCVSYRDHCTVSHASTAVCSAVQSSAATQCIRRISKFDIPYRKIKHRRKQQFHRFEFPKLNNRNNKENAQKSVAAIMATLNIGP
jgi:hypothetical protein